MMRLNWAFARFLERLDLAGSVALAALVALLCFLFLIWQPAEQALAAMEENSHGQPVRPSQLSPEAALKQFAASFPNNQHRVDSIAMIIDTAAAMGLGMDNIAYQTKQVQNDRLNHYQIDFNIVGQYRDVRQYLATVLAKIPTVSLDSLAMDRLDVEQDFIQARVRLTLHFAS